MNSRKTTLRDFLQANKQVLNSPLDANQKMETLRKQTMALEELTNSSNEYDKTSIIREHFKEFQLNEQDYLSHIEQRSKSVENFLRGVPRRASPTFNLSAETFLNENRITLEPGCSGSYESCKGSEISAEDLKVFQNKLPKEQCPAQYIDTPPRKIVKTDTFNVDQNIMPSVQGRQPSSLTNFSTSIPVDSGYPKMQFYRSGREDLRTTSQNRLTSLNNFSSNVSTESGSVKLPGFRTARDELILQNMKKHGDPGGSSSSSSNTLFNYGASKKSLGARRNVRSGFVPPIRQEENSSTRSTPPDSIDSSPTDPVDERLRNIDPKMIQLITNEIMHKYKPIEWSDIAGLEYAKSTIKEAVVWPLLRPDIFTGLRRPPRGILLFGPPGTGKTLIGKCIASQSRSTFFSISASSLTSKWVGDGEKMVRALFAVAAVNQPSVVFIDEIDSLLSQRSESEHESSRRIKTEFLVQLDGACTSDDERILIVGATNRPQELDEAARRRLVRRLYIPLPDLPARIQILTNLLHTVRNSINKEEISKVGALTSGYSGADMETLCREASMEPIRSIPPDEIPFFSEENVRPVQFGDFNSALLRVRASVTQNDLQQYSDWNKMYGSGQ